MIKRILAVTGPALLTVATTAHALTMVPVADSSLVDRADAIVRAQVVAGSVGNENGPVMTNYDLEVLATLKGEVSSPAVVRMLGGIDLERGMVVKIFGVPEWRSGDTLLLFLRHADDGTYRVLHLVQGAFRERGTGSERFYLRSSADIFELREPFRAPPRSSRESRVEIRRLEPLPRSAERFERWIADRVAGLERDSDYLLASTPQERSVLVSPFTFLAGDDFLLRWFEFDDGDKVGWHRHLEGQEGFGNGASPEFKKARKAWKKKFSGVPIRLRNRGKTSSTTGFTASDARNTLLQRDFNEFIDDDFECPGGGILAVGGVSSTDLIPVQWKGTSTVRIREAEIVMNDGIDCFLAGNKKAIAQIYAHELGHTLGLGHSCGDDFSPKCSKSEFLSEAVMVANLDEIFGAKIRDDDVLGVRQLYDIDFWAASCETRVPGATSFCTKCGPCGEGQGNCKNDSDCFGDLVCTRDVGADFGFDTDVNVCTED